MLHGDLVGGVTIVDVQVIDMMTMVGFGRGISSD